MRKLCTLLLIGFALASIRAAAQGRRIITFPYSQLFTWVTATTNGFPASNADGGEFTLDAGTTGWTTSIISHGLNNNGGAGNAIRVQTIAGTNSGVAGFVWYGDFTGYCADSLSIDWAKVTNGANGSRTNDLRLATNGGAGNTFTDIPLANVAGGVWPAFDNMAAAQSGVLRVKLPGSLGGAPDVRIRIYSINTGGTGSQPRVVLDNLTIIAGGAPVASRIDSTGAARSNALAIIATSGNGADSILVIRRTGAPPTAPPADGIRYALNQGLNGTDTVAFLGPATIHSIPITGLQPSTTYYFTVYGFRSCNSRYSAAAATSGTTAVACTGVPATIANVVNLSRTQRSATISYDIGPRMDSVLIIRGSRGAPVAVPETGAQYLVGEGLNSADTVAYSGPAIVPLTMGDLQPGTRYTYAIYGIQSCNGTFSVTPAIGAVRTLPPLAIIAQPAGGDGCIGMSFTFRVTAAGSNLRYQWRKDGLDIPGATLSSYSIDSLTPALAGRYDVVISGANIPVESPDEYAAPAFSTATSDTARLAVYAPTIITSQPVGTEVCRGGTVTLAVAASGSGLTYRWRKNGDDIPGANGLAYIIKNVSLADAGKYDVIVAGACPPAVTSSRAELVVNAEPSIVEQPRSMVMCRGQHVSFSVAAAGKGLAYQWRKDGRAIPGAIFTTYVIDSATLADAGVYDVVVTGLCSPPATSDGARLTIESEPIIAAQPLDQTIHPGAAVTFAVHAYGPGVLRYQWQKNGVDIRGATGPSYTISTVTLDDIGGYNCVIGNACTPPMVVTNSAWLFVNATAGIVAPPQGGTICAGETIALRTIASGAGNRFQWKRDGVDIPGASRPEYIIVNASAADAGTYTCSVTPHRGAILNTAAATVVVNMPVAIVGEPVDGEVCSGQGATLSVSARGSGLRYRWRHERIDLPGGNDSTYAVGAVSAADTGRYDCLVTGACGGTLASRDAVLRLAPAVTIVTQPGAKLARSGEPITFSVLATGTDLTYQWRKDGVVIPGATAATFTIDSVASADAGLYDVLVTGCSGTVLSQGAFLRLAPATLVVTDSVLNARNRAGAPLLLVTPNPSDGTTRLDVHLPDGARMRTGARLLLFDSRGNIAADMSGSLAEHNFSYAWLHSTALPSGSYYCHLETPEWSGMLGVVVVVH